MYVEKYGRKIKAYAVCPPSCGSSHSVPETIVRVPYVLKLNDAIYELHLLVSSRFRRIVLLSLSVVLCPSCSHCGEPPGCDGRETNL